MPNRLTPEIVAAAIEGYEAQKARLAAKIAELRQMLDGKPAEPAVAPAGRKRRRLSAAGRKRIAEAARKRWGAVRAAKEKAKK